MTGEPTRTAAPRIPSGSRRGDAGAHERTGGTDYLAGSSGFPFTPASASRLARAEAGDKNYDGVSDDEGADSSGFSYTPAGAYTRARS